MTSPENSEIQLPKDTENRIREFGMFALGRLEALGGELEV